MIALSDFNSEYISSSILYLKKLLVHVIYFSFEELEELEEMVINLNPEATEKQICKEFFLKVKLYMYVCNHTRRMDLLVSYTHIVLPTPSLQQMILAVTPVLPLYSSC